MSISVKAEVVPEPVAVRVTPDTLAVDLADGRTISVPLLWFPRLAHGTQAEWANYELSFLGVHWPDLNEDISVESLLRGERSGEGPKSLQRWLDFRARGEKEPLTTLPLPPEIEKDLKGMGITWDE